MCSEVFALSAHDRKNTPRLLPTYRKAVEYLNLLHMRHAIEVAKAGSLGKAAENLMIAAPNISRSVKELESDLGITIFERTQSGMRLTPEGDEFINYARGIIDQIEQLEQYYKSDSPKKLRFSVSVPRACYISDAFAEFSKTLSHEPVEIFYKETNSRRTINNILTRDYKLGIIRYADSYDEYFKSMLDEKDLEYELVTEFSYSLIMSAHSPLAAKDDIKYSDLSELVEIAHADPYVPSMPFSRVVKEELPDNIKRRIFIYERASQFDLLSQNPETFMWVSPAPKELLEKYGLVRKPCAENRRIYKDVLIYKKGYKLTPLDRAFVTALCEAKRKYIDGETQ